jgi:transcriptional regulator with XRE-family HTH domain
MEGASVSRTPTFEEIGARIRVEREKRGLSQQDLAGVLGVTRPVVTKIESGTKAINSVELRKIADYLGVSVDELTAPVEDRSLAVRFRKSTESEAFIERVSAIERLVRDMLIQVKLRERQRHG